MAVKRGQCMLKQTKNHPVVRANSLLEQVKGPHVGQILISWMSEVHLFKKSHKSFLLLSSPPTKQAISIIHFTRIV